MNGLCNQCVNVRKVSSRAVHNSIFSSRIEQKLLKNYFGNTIMLPHEKIERRTNLFNME